jgi:hypothetical protein
MNLINLGFSGNEVPVSQRDCPQTVARHRLDHLFDGALSCRFCELKKKEKLLCI